MDYSPALELAGKQQQKKITKMDTAIRNLSQDEEFLYSSRILIALMYNILDDPVNEKYRRLRTGAKVSDANALDSYL